MRHPPFFVLLLAIAAAPTAPPIRAAEESPSGAVKLGGPADESDKGGDFYVDVIVDMSPAGEKVARPTPGNPAYYLPYPLGNKNLGYSPHFQRPPTAGEVDSLVQKELSSQGYLTMTHEHHPSLVLNYVWGYIDGGPDFDLNPRLYPSVLKPGEMQDILDGDIHDINPDAIRVAKAQNWRFAGNFERYHQGHWYILVSAFTFDSWLKNFKEQRHLRPGEKAADQPVLLWRAHISTPLWGHYFDQVAQTMIATAGPMFGRSVTVPQYIHISSEPNGRVVVGAPVVKDFPAAPAAAKP